MAKRSTERKRRPGRPTTTGTGTLIGVRAPADFLARLDKWRAAQSVPPSRPAAILHLAGTALK